MSQVLLVEDSCDDRELTLDAFRERGMEHTIVAVDDGERALDYLFGRGRFSDPKPVRPKVILLDLNLPKLNGDRVLQQLRANPETQDIPVVMLTTSDSSDDRRRCYRLGANSYVRKPVAYETFREVASQLGVYWVNVNLPTEKEA